MLGSRACVRSDVETPDRPSRRSGRSWSGWSCYRRPPSSTRPPRHAVRAFQQSRGIGVDGLVGPETWQALDGARWKLGARTLFHSVPTSLVGEDVRALQERLLEMGFDSGRADAIYGPRTARAVAQFQREVGLTPDGSCGPQTMKALRRLGRKVVGGRPQWLREAEAFRQSGSSLVGKTIVIDPGHGGAEDLGVVVPDGSSAGPRPTWRSTSPPGSRAGCRGRHARAPDPRPVARCSR